ncbi:MAG: hypothetical protein IKE70_00870 [Bacilli bacterium]|nr:hypothetical protein [Bacilli bacterium]
MPNKELTPLDYIMIIHEINSGKSIDDYPEKEKEELMEKLRKRADEWDERRKQIQLFPQEKKEEKTLKYEYKPTNNNTHNK